MHVRHMREPSSRPLVWVVGAAFLLATNYCLSEAFAASHTPSESSHHQAPSGHHDEGSPASGTQDDPCCTALQAILTPQPSLQLAATTHQLFQAMAVQAADAVRCADRSLAPSGLSPPPREPTPTRPFYRTTFANHAPPVLA